MKAMTVSVRDELQELTSLLATLSDKIDSRFRDRWLQDIKDLDLRSALDANPRISERIVSDILANSGLAEDTSLKAFDGQDLLAQALQVSHEDLSLRIGLAWNSNLLSQTLFSGGLRSALADVPQDQVRSAMVYRQFADEPETYEPISLADIQADGTACFYSWLYALPEGVRARVLLTLPANPISVTARTARRQVSLTNRVLQDWIAA